MTNHNKAKLLQNKIIHFDISKTDCSEIISSYQNMSFSSRDTARAYEIYLKALKDKNCSIILTLAGSGSAGGLMHVWRDLIQHNMIDAVVATGASIIDMDFFEAIGFNHYQCPDDINCPDDQTLRSLFIDRIYDTYIDEEDLQTCDQLIFEIANKLPSGLYSSRKFIYELGHFLAQKADITVNGKKITYKNNSLIEAAYHKNIPIFCPAFSDCSAGFGLVKHQYDRLKKNENYISIDSVADFKELTEVKIKAGTTGLFMVGGGVPKNFAQDTIICAEILGKKVEMHKYCVQITIADPRDGSCSSSTLKEACSWGKVDVAYEQMVFAEATTVAPIILSAAFHHLKKINFQRKPRNLNLIFK